MIDSMDCKREAMFLWIQGRPGLMVAGIRDNEYWKYECDVVFCPYVDLREFIAALESANDEDGIIIEGDVILGYRSCYPRMMHRTPSCWIVSSWGVKWYEEQYLSINLSVAPTMLNVSQMSSMVILTHWHGPNPMTEFNFIGGPAVVQFYMR
ncbi:hypothetical protein Ancab_018781 [Ancistrocladus abbreviatus]